MSNAFSGYSVMQARLTPSCKLENALRFLALIASLCTLGHFRHADSKMLRISSLDAERPISKANACTSLKQAWRCTSLVLGCMTRLFDHSMHSHRVYDSNACPGVPGAPAGYGD